MHFEVLCPLKAVGREGWEDDSSLRAGFNTLSLTSVFKQNVKACKPPDQWKIARVSAAFQKGWEEDRTCYRPLSMLSIPSKLMESYVASNITNHMVTQNLLVDRQWAYRKGKSTEQCIATKAERPGNQRRYLAVVKELPYRTKTIRQNQRIWLRYTHYSSQSVAIVGPRTHVILLLHKRSPKITTLCGNLFVCRRHSNILYRRNDGFANKLTKRCSSWTTGMVRQIRWYHTQKNVKQWSCSANQHLLALSKLFALATTS